MKKGVYPHTKSGRKRKTETSFQTRGDILDNSKASSGFGVGVYLYGLIDQNDLSKNLEGVDAKPVELVPFRDLWAIVSPVRLSEFGEEAFQRNLQNLDWFGKKILIHDQVLIKLMQNGAVIPIRFGAIFASQENLLKGLEKIYPEAKRIAKRIQEKEEWSVKLTSDLEKIRPTVEAESPKIIESKLKLLKLTPGVRYLAEKKLEDELNHEVDLEISKAVESLKDALLAWVQDFKPVQGLFTKGDENGHPLVFQSAFLVTKKNVHGFLNQMDHVRSAWEFKGYQLKVEGPYPAYHFCDLTGWEAENE